MIYLAHRNDLIAAQAAAEQARATKDETLDALIAIIKTNSHSGPGTATGAPRHGEDWVFLDWKTSIDCGAPATYKVMRRGHPAGPWEDAATTVTTGATLVEQGRDKGLECRIIAANKAGEGGLSNTVMVVL